ncbi:transcription initiation factor TFIID subunit 11 [Gryganskiella cystojenkinii]|nr:transcription initiation factor TFIID subunit 11 [Gryganskiella cystojenkinii]
MNDPIPSTSTQRPVRSDTAAATPPPTASTATSLTQAQPSMAGPKKRKNASMTPTTAKPKKQKLRRNLDGIIPRKELPNVPAAGGVNKSGQRMVKGPYKKREKKDKNGKKIPAGTSSAGAAGTGPGLAISDTGASGVTATGGKKGKGTSAGPRAASAPLDINAIKPGLSSSLQDAADNDGRSMTAQGDANAASTEGGGDNAEGKEDDEDDHEEEPEYSEFEWNQEANTRGRSKDDLKALLDCFSDEQLQRYEVYRRSVLNRNTVKKLVGTILNQQVTQTMAFVVAGFCKVFVGEMVEKAREVMEDWGETGAIRPEHLREAQRRYRKQELQGGIGVKPAYGYKRRMFCR